MNNFLDFFLLILLILSTLALALFITIKVKFPTEQTTQRMLYEQKKSVTHQYQVFGFVFFAGSVQFVIYNFLATFAPTAAGLRQQFSHFLCLPTVIGGLSLISAIAINYRVSMWHSRGANYPTGNWAVLLGVGGFIMAGILLTTWVNR